MKENIKFFIKKWVLQYFKSSILVCVAALTVQSSSAQNQTSEPSKAAIDKRAEKLAQPNNMPKAISITEFRQRNAAVSTPQNNPQQAPFAGTKKSEPALSAPVPAKVDTKNDPKYQSRSASGSANKPAPLKTAGSNNGTTDKQNRIQ